MASQFSRHYDLVVLGATGFTGKLIAEHVAQTFPTNLNWAVAGRSTSKLERVVQDLKALNPDRTQPAIEEVQLTKEELTALAKKTEVLVNSVGPFFKYSTPVVEACAEEGTHYLDVTGESPWVKSLVDKYHATAERSGAIIIPQCGVESAHPDIMSYALAQHLRQHAGLPTAELVYAMHTFKGVPSGGTLATILTIFDFFGARGIAAGCVPSAMTPAPLPQPRASNSSLLQTLFGVRRVPGLGVTTTNPFGAPDVPIVSRSWALLQSRERPDAYGPEFRFAAAMLTPNAVLGAFQHVFGVLGGLMIALKPVRWLLGFLVRAPGTGPTNEEESRGSLEFRGLAIPKAGSPQALGRIQWKGGLYHWTAVLVAQAAATLLYDGEETPARQLGGGVLTPAMLGPRFLERLQEQGTKVELSMLDK